MKKLSVVCLIFLSLFLQTTKIFAQEPITSYNSEVNRNDPVGLLKVDDDTIKKIANIHPRFAVYLAGFRGKGKELWINSKVQMIPVKITAKDLELWLKPVEESEPLIKDFVQKQSPSIKNRKPAIFVTYTEINSDQKSAETRLIVVEHCVDDPPQIDFMKLKLVKATEEGKDFWKIAECFIE